MNQLRKLTSTFITLALLLPSLVAMAQDTPPAGAPVIKIKVLDDMLGKKIYLDVKGTEAETPIWVDFGDVANGTPYYKTTAGTATHVRIKETVMNTTITVYGNVAWMDCKLNGISDIDLSGTTILKEFYCEQNKKLKTLDLQGNSELQKLKVKGCSELATLKLDQCKKLTFLNCGGTNLEALDLTNQTDLVELWAIGCNNLKSVNVSNSPNLKIAWMEACNLTSLNLTNNNKLTRVSTAYNHDFTTLLMGQTNLEKLDLRYCKVDVCALNKIFRLLPKAPTGSIEGLFIDGNPDATKAQTSIATDKGWPCDVQGDGTGCIENRPPEGTPRLGLTVKNNAFLFFHLTTMAPETVWIELEPGVFTTLEATTEWPKGDKPRYKAKGTSVNIYGNLKGFDAGDSETITEIDLSQMTNLVELFIFKNALNKLDISTLKELEWLYCEGNKISSLDLSKNPKLEVLVCKGNQLKTLDLSHNPAINFIAAQENKIEPCDLNKLFKSLPIPTKQVGLLQIKKNPGATTCTTNLLEGKNWKIDELGDGTGCQEGSIDALNEVDAQNLLSIFPNPASEYVIVTTQPNTRVVLFDAQGSLIARAHSDASGQARFDLGHLAKGVYFVQGKEGVHRLIVE